MTFGKARLVAPYVKFLFNGSADKDLITDLAEKIVTQRHQFVSYLAVCSLPGRECLDVEKRERQEKLFAGFANDELVTLCVAANSWPSLMDVRDALGLVDESRRKHMIMSAKESSSSVSVGGVSVYGSLLGAAIEKFGWTYDYVLWGISLINLELLLEDMPSSIYLTSDELKRVPAIARNGRGGIDAGDPKNINLIRRMFGK